jgi:hypothetical protein
VKLEVDAGTWQNVTWDPLPEPRLKTIDGVVEKLLPLVEKEKGKERAELVRRVALVLRQAAINGRQTARYTLAGKVLPNLQATLADAGKLLKDAPDLDEKGRRGLDYLANAATKGLNPPAAEVGALRSASQSLRRYAPGHDTVDKRCVAAADLLDYVVVLHENQEFLTLNYRDKCMAENAEWIGKTYLPGEKIMLWAHNYHVSNAAGAGAAASMGQYLTADLKDKYFPVGFVFLGGSFQAIGPRPDGQGQGLLKWDVPDAKAETLEAELNKLKMPRVFLDFGPMSEAARKWVDANRLVRSIGAVYYPAMADQYFMSDSVGKTFRGLIFIAKTTRARPVKATRDAMGIQKDW